MGTSADHAYIAKLVHHGARITEQRKKLIHLLASCERPLSAMEIYQELERSFPRMSFGTVYQNIKLLADLELIESFVISNQLRYRLIDRDQPHYHFICMDCEKATSIPFNPSETPIPLPQQLTFVDFKLDVFGYCELCSDPGTLVSNGKKTNRIKGADRHE